jgi:hypothetical protein
MEAQELDFWYRGPSAEHLAPVPETIVLRPVSGRAARQILPPPNTPFIFAATTKSVLRSLPDCAAPPHAAQSLDLGT